jgi:hypothetical protein
MLAIPEHTDGTLGVLFCHGVRTSKLGGSPVPVRRPADGSTTVGEPKKLRVCGQAGGILIGCVRGRNTAC